jgi:hypothetical protein
MTYDIDEESLASSSEIEFSSVEFSSSSSYKILANYHYLL